MSEVQALAKGNTFFPAVLTPEPFLSKVHVFSPSTPTVSERGTKEPVTKQSVNLVCSRRGGFYHQSLVLLDPDQMFEFRQTNTDDTD